MRRCMATRLPAEMQMRWTTGFTLDQCTKSSNGSGNVITSAIPPLEHARLILGATWSSSEDGEMMAGTLSPQFQLDGFAEFAAMPIGQVFGAARQCLICISSLFAGGLPDRLIEHLAICQARRQVYHQHGL